MWPKNEDDHMELGESGLVPVKDGGFMEKDTGNYISEEGVVYDKYGNVIYDPIEEDDQGLF